MLITIEEQRKAWAKEKADKLSDKLKEDLIYTGKAGFSYEKSKGIFYKEVVKYLSDIFGPLGYRVTTEEADAPYLIDVYVRKK